MPTSPNDVRQRDAELQPFGAPKPRPPLTAFLMVLTLPACLGLATLASLRVAGLIEPELAWRSMAVCVVLSLAHAIVVPWLTVRGVRSQARAWFHAVTGMTSLLVLSTWMPMAPRTVLLMMVPLAFLCVAFHLGPRQLLLIAVISGSAVVGVTAATLGPDDGDPTTTLIFPVLTAVWFSLIVVALVAGTVNRSRWREQQELVNAHAVLLHLSDAVVKVDLDGAVALSNARLRTLLRRAEPIAIGDKVDALFPIRHGPAFGQILAEVAGQFRDDVRRQVDTSDWNRKRSMSLALGAGERIDVELTIIPDRHPDRPDELEGLIVVVRDESETRRQMAELRRMANNDIVTGLFNRRGFIDELDAMVKASVSPGGHVDATRPPWVMVIDLDRFKVFNDACGHAAGDEMLCMIARQLDQLTRDGAIVARLGGDEFGVALAGMPADQVGALASQILHRIAELRFDREGRQMRIHASIGVAAVDPAQNGIASVLTHADAACYLAKDRGRNRVQFYRPGDGEVARHQTDMAWVRRIQDALARERFILYGQRIVPLEAAGPADARPGRWRVEVLLRMVGDHGEPIAPGAFLPTAERYGLMPDIDRLVIRLSIAALTRLRGQGGVLMPLSINVSASSLREPGLLAFIETSIREAGLPFDLFTFELTESATILDIGQVRRFFDGLRRLGARVSLDDVGSGFNSFMQMRELPFDQIKLDGTYVRTVAESRVDRLFVETLQHIAGVLGVETVAEFVENEMIAVAMADIGVDYVQGYGIHRPEPIDAALSYVDGEYSTRQLAMALQGSRAERRAGAAEASGTGGTTHCASAPDVIDADTVTAQGDASAAGPAVPRTGHQHSSRAVLRKQQRA